jgi:hypothetical protein
MIPVRAWEKDLDRARVARGGREHESEADRRDPRGHGDDALDERRSVGDEAGSPILGTPSPPALIRVEIRCATCRAWLVDCKCVGDRRVATAYDVSPLGGSLSPTPRPSIYP